MSEELDKSNIPEHIAIIMDGNRRWARNRGLDPKDGHKAGVVSLENITKFSNKIGIKYLTVYAFSTENWKRTEEEVGALMLLLKNKLDNLSKRANNEEIRINILGDIAKLSDGLQKSINNIMEKTKNNKGLTLNIAFNYGGRAEIIYAIKNISQQVQNNELKIEDINEEIVSKNLYTKGIKDPDLLIRTSGEQRLSNFLPWQLVYSEFVFVQKHWPDFNEDDLINIIKNYQNRHRNFGK